MDLFPEGANDTMERYLSLKNGNFPFDNYYTAVMVNCIFKSVLDPRLNFITVLDVVQFF